MTTYRITALEIGHVAEAIYDHDIGRLVLVLPYWTPAAGDPEVPSEDEIRTTMAEALGRPVVVRSLGGGEGYGPDGRYADVWQVEIRDL